MRNESKVAIVTAICLLVIAFVSKTHGIQMSFIASYAPAFIFIIYILSMGYKEKQGIRVKWWYWSLVIALITFFMLALYGMG